MSDFFSDKVFADAKENLKKKGSGLTFFGEGRYEAELIDVRIKTSENPKKLGIPQLWGKFKITNVIQGEDHAVGDEVNVFADSYLGDKVLEMLAGMTKGLIDPDDLTTEMANKLVDPNNHEFDGKVYRFDRIRETYTGKDGTEKSYVPLGLTKPVE